MSLTTLAIILLILVMIGGLPRWPYSANWGYGPVGTVVGIIILIIILRLAGIV